MVPSPSGNGKYGATLRSYSSLGLNPLPGPHQSWVWSFPSEFFLHEKASIHVTASGADVIAALYDSATQLTHVVRLDGSSGAVKASAFIDTPGGFNVSLLSADERSLYLAAGSRSTIVDVVDPSIYVGKWTYMQGTLAHAVSSDGSRFYIGAQNRVTVWERVGGGYLQGLDLTLGGVDCYPQRLILAKNDSILVGSFILGNTRDIRTVAWSLPGGQAITDHTLVGSGTYTNKVTGLAISADGRVFAVGSYGDQAALLPHVALYNSGESSDFARFHFQGSVMDLSLSEDGAWLAAARKSIHANESGGGGALETISTRPTDVQVTGVPSAAAAPIRISVRPGSGPNVFLLSHTALEPQPLIFNAGTLYLRRQGIQWTLLTPEGGGLYGVDWHLGSASGHLVGETLYFQGFSSAPRRLTESFATVTVLP